MDISKFSDILAKVLNQYLKEEFGNRVSQFSVRGLAASLEQEFSKVAVKKEKDEGKEQKMSSKGARDAKPR